MLIVTQGETEEEESLSLYWDNEENAIIEKESELINQSREIES